jgi:hypothetical protein
LRLRAVPRADMFTRQTPRKENYHAVGKIRANPLCACRAADEQSNIYEARCLFFI